MQRDLVKSLSTLYQSLHRHLAICCHICYFSSTHIFGAIILFVSFLIVLPTLLLTSSHLVRHVAICSQATSAWLASENSHTTTGSMRLNCPSCRVHAYLQAKDAGVGVVVQAKETIKFQVFNTREMKSIFVTLSGFIALQVH